MLFFVGGGENRGMRRRHKGRHRLDPFIRVDRVYVKSCRISVSRVNPDRVPAWKNKEFASFGKRDKISLFRQRETAAASAGHFQVGKVGDFTCCVCVE